MKHELLIPAGDMKCLYQAVSNGADAVYVGCKDFGARKFATNFDNEEILSAIKLCHLYGVKIYATMNTLVKDDEVPYFLGQVEYLYKNGIDAIIMQDFGMICLVRQKYPELEIHASTQANNSSKATAELFYNLGVKRVVLSRELSLQEIESIKVPIEKEVFIHGALCISYSGCCLMSSMIGARSGNRGECAGCCRLPYSLEKHRRIIEKEKYLLSTKELNTAPRFKELLNSSITSFKVEGRMKSPEYVGFITKYYRNLIDTNGSYALLEEDTKKLKTIFNRDFTEGNLFNTPAKELLNTDSPNHIGLPIGQVESITNKKIKIKLNERLNQYDAIRFLHSGQGFIVNYLYDERDNLIKSANDVCYVDNKIGLMNSDVVCKTQDFLLLSDLKTLPPRKVPVTFVLNAHVGKPLNMVISDGKNSFQMSGQEVQIAETSPMTEKRIRQQIDKLGDTPFVSTSTIINCDENIFISVKELNELRRTLVTTLSNKRMNDKPEIKVNNFMLEPLNIPFIEPGITAVVNNLEQQDQCRRENLIRIYSTNENLYNKANMYPFDYYKVPRNKINPTELLKKKNLVSDYFDYKISPDIVGDYGLNVYNIYTMYYLYKHGIKILTPSVELTEEETIKLLNNFITTFGINPNVELFGYGRVENMIIKGNILDLAPNEYTYTLIDNKKRRFPVYYDGSLTHILNSEITQIKNYNQIKKVASVRLDFFDETEEDIRKILKQFQ